MGKKRLAFKPALSKDMSGKHFSLLIWLGSALLLLLSFLLVWYAIQARPFSGGGGEEQTSLSLPETPATPVSQEQQPSDPQPEPAPEQVPEPEQEFPPGDSGQDEPAFTPIANLEPLEPIDPLHWSLRVVDKDHPLQPDFTVDLMAVTGGQLVEKNIAYLVELMLADAAEAGIELVVVSGYRSVAQQEKLIRTRMYSYVLQGLTIEEARRQAEASLDPPGLSEHHTGLAIDIASADHRALDAGFAETSAYAWLSQNAFRYGLVLRYPKGKQGATGQGFRPWHYRYVGVENAVAMQRHQLCLEEYLEQAPRRI